LHESKNSVFFPVFLKNKGNSRAIDRVFKEIRENLSIFNPSYISCKGLYIALIPIVVRIPV